MGQAALTSLLEAIRRLRDAAAAQPRNLAEITEAANILFNEIAFPNGADLSRTYPSLNARQQVLVFDLQKWLHGPFWPGNVAVDHHHAAGECVVRMNSLIDELEAAPAPPRPPRLAVADGELWLDGRPVLLDMTAERKDDLLAGLGQLLARPGNWLSATALGENTARPGLRFDRLFGHHGIPAKVRNFIDAAPGKGYRYDDNGLA
jgi:hypothetical protein